jgi:hypothetical protein
VRLFLATQVPGYDGVVVDQGIYPVRIPIIGYIGDVRVYDAGAAITNETVPGHLLFYGFVTRTIITAPDGIYVGGYGAGANTGGPIVALVNQIFGQSLFAQQNQLTHSYFNQHFSPTQ